MKSIYVRGTCGCGWDFHPDSDAPASKRVASTRSAIIHHSADSDDEMCWNPGPVLEYTVSESRIAVDAATA